MESSDASGRLAQYSESPTEFLELMARVRTGSQEAMAELCRRYGGHLRRVVRRKLSQRLRGQFDSMDFMQDVWASFVAVPLEQYTFDTPEELVLFLSRVASNKVVDAHRRRVGSRNRAKQEQPLPDSQPLPTSREPTPSQVFVADERWERLLAGLTPVQRQVVDLLRDGHTHDEISDRLGLHIKVIQRLVRKLAERLEP